jgi:uncharacterized protein with PIN domain
MAKFIADNMLGTLSRKLRVFGHDVTYNKENTDPIIIDTAKKEGRIILTSDKELHSIALRKGLKSIYILELTDEDRFVIIFKKLGLKPQLVPTNSRCSICNHGIKRVSKDDLKNRIPNEIIGRYNHFYACINCGKVYWTGSHWDKFEKFSIRVKRKLQKEN